MKPQETISTLLANAPISDTHKAKMTSAVSALSPQEQQVFADLFVTDPSWIVRLSENLTIKEDILASGDTNLWKELIALEIADLEGMSQDA